MTISQFISKQLLEPNESTGKYDFIDGAVMGSYVCKDYGPNGEDLDQLHATARECMSGGWMMPRTRKRFSSWIFRDMRIEDDMRLPMETGVVDISDATSKYRSCVEAATSFADLRVRGVGYLKQSFQRSELTHSGVVMIDRIKRNVQRQFSQYDRLIKRLIEDEAEARKAREEEFTGEQKREMENALRLEYYAKFDFSGDDLDTAASVLESMLLPLTDIEARMQAHFMERGRSLNDLIEEADRICPYIDETGSFGKRWTDPRLREPIFIQFLILLVTDAETMHEVFGEYNWDNGQWPAFALGPVRGVPGCGLEERFVVCAYSKTGTAKQPKKRPANARPIWRSVGPDRLCATGYGGPHESPLEFPTLARPEMAEADHLILMLAMFCSRVYQFPAIVDSFDGDEFIICMLMIELYRLFPQADLMNYRGDPSTLLMVRDRAFVKGPTTRVPSDPSEVAGIYWVRNTCRITSDKGPVGRYTIFDMYAAYEALYRTLKDHSLMRHAANPSLDAQVLEMQLYAGELNASREMPALALAFAASSENDYNLLSFKGAAKALRERVQDVIDAGVGYMRHPNGTPYFTPYCRMSFIKPTPSSCHDAIAYGMSLHSAEYFLSFCHLMSPAASMSGVWPLFPGDPESPAVADVYQYGHWARSRMDKAGASLFLVNCDDTNCRKLRQLDTCFGALCIKFRVLPSGTNMRALLESSRDAPDGAHPLDGVDYVVAAMGQGPYILHGTEMPEPLPASEEEEEVDEAATEETEVPVKEEKEPNQERQDGYTVPAPPLESPPEPLQTTGEKRPHLPEAPAPQSDPPPPKRVSAAAIVSSLLSWL